MQIETNSVGSMKIYDTMQKKVVPFRLNKNRIVKMYVCGPTVYDSPHIGHAKTYIFFDALAKYLRAQGFQVFYVQNITDLDDKIITKAAQENLPTEIISKRYLMDYLKIMKSLKIDSVNLYVPATMEFRKIISQIKTLVRKGYAYETDDGVYFSVSRFPDYGKLSGQDLNSLRSGSRIDINENKRDPRDFVIWKKMKPGEPYWDSPWGKGRPGWHIEDTAITDAFLGKTYDIHGGGSDLIFPHHEAEIAIERSVSGRKILSRYWIHTGMLNIEGEKMSKSLHNYVTIDEVLKDFTPEDLRYALLNCQFNTQLSFSGELMEESRKNVNALSSIYNKLKQKAGDENMESDYSIINSLDSFLEYNFDFRGMFSKLMSYVSEWNKNLDAMDSREASLSLSALKWVNQFTGVIREGENSARSDDLIRLLLSARKSLRTAKDFSSSDAIRSGLRKLGVHIEDQGSETIWWYSDTESE
ncbi:MAG: cysteine--tRNA ligase [Candidatus Thermoplasmatota archaeon]|nr:cysteine--tRNA ligase [Candidatus Thermoplasmatota archaeon]